MFSIVIPTFNNINYLKLCLSSLDKNSKLNHEIIIHVNDGSDGTLDFINKSKYKFTHSHENIGLCKAMNQAAKLSTKKYLVYAHDDMYFCPGWDLEFDREIKNHSENKDFFLSGTMIQPFESFIYLDCGKNIDEFNEEKLLKNFNKINFNDFQGSTWAPSLIPLKTWNKVGGLSEEYGPGLGSDPDLNMKLWKIGVRLFKGLGNSRVYHFSSISLRKKVWNDGHKIFLLKWALSIKFFKKYYLRSDEFFNGELKNPKLSLGFIFGLLKCKLTFFFYKFFKS
tara:strand:- start:7 stop:849 length:843 start_codon:yes stop_codon:yes gene_type:complete